MFVVCVTVFVKPNHETQFIAAALENARQTRKEPGNLRFDVLQAQDDLTRFMLYEVYLSADDFAKHQQTPHYLHWKQLVADWMREPRVGVKHRSVFFDNSEQ